MENYNSIINKKYKKMIKPLNSVAASGCTQGIEHKQKGKNWGIRPHYSQESNKQVLLSAERQNAGGSELWSW